MKNKIEVTQNKEQEIPATVIADSIVEIAAGMRKLNQTRLRREAIVTLIHYNSKVPRRDIEIVMNNLNELESKWLKPKP
jgi:hypothetical protein